MRRRWLVIGGSAIGGLVVLSVVAVLLFYGRIGIWVLRTRVMPKVAAKLDRDVEVGTIEVRRGRAILRDVVIRGPNDIGAPLLRIDRVAVEFDFWDSLLGNATVHEIELTGAAASLVRGDDDNFSDLIERLRPSDGSEDAATSPSGGLRPERVIIEDASVEVRDSSAGVTFIAAGIAGDLVPDEPVVLVVREIEAASDLGPSASLRNAKVSFDPRDLITTARVELAGGTVALWPGMALTGLTGTIAQRSKPGQFAIDLVGGYGGVEGELWSANGWLDPRARAGKINIRADRFTFDRISPVLEGSPIKDYDKTSVSAEFTVGLEEGRGTFHGDFDLVGLNVSHRILAKDVVRDISAKGSIKGSFDQRERIVEVERARLSSGGVDYQLEGYVRLAGGVDPENGLVRSFDRIGGRLRIPSIPCQTVLESIPTAFIPHLKGFTLSGMFATDANIAIDWEDLNKVVLGGSVGLRGCKVTSAPERLSHKRLDRTFEHEVEVGKDKYEMIIVGNESLDFVPVWDVSRHLLNSFMTTEDSSFYKHRGFIVREFRTALIKDLQVGYFKYGASSITMQTVKNVFLDREKTLSRKFQELFLTWYIETRLSKDRIFEIYVNAIEYGPGLYGLKRAAKTYFGKHPRDLNPVEAAFFSTLLPAPKRRYKQFCKGKLNRFTENKIQRILKLMLKRERLTQEEYDEAVVTPLEFWEEKGKLCKVRPWWKRKS